MFQPWLADRRPEPNPDRAAGPDRHAVPALLQQRKVDPGGRITTLAGGDIQAFGGDGGPATEALLYSPVAVEMGPDASVYVVDKGNYRVRRIGPDGIIRTVAGDGQSAWAGDGGAATSASLAAPSDVAVGRDGTLFIAEEASHRLRVVTPQGLIFTSAGSGPTGLSGGGYGGDGLDPEAARFNRPSGVALGPDGAVYVADTYNLRVRSIRWPMPSGDYQNGWIASEDGACLYEFDLIGRHIRTLNALTGAELLKFEYDAQSRLAAVEDVAGNRTTVEHRDTTVTLRAPAGQATKLTFDSNGFAASLTTPLLRTWVFKPDAGGLIRSFINPRSMATDYDYDELGRLNVVQDAAGRVRTLERRDAATSYTVILSENEHQLQSHTVISQPDGGVRVVNDGCCELQSILTLSTDGTAQIQRTDGSILTEQPAPDPRFGLQTPYLAETGIMTPGSRVLTASMQRSMQPDDSTGPFDYVSLGQTLTVDGRSRTQNYDAKSRVLETHSAAGRQAWTTLDAAGRVIEIRIGDQEPLIAAYDAKGRLSHLGREVRINRLDWDADGWLAAIVDPLNQTTSFHRDADGQPTRLERPGGETWNFSWDAAGNLLSAESGGGLVVHDFTFHADNLLETYRMRSGEYNESFSYDTQGHLIERLLPSGRFVRWDRNIDGRPRTIDIPEGTHQFTYDSRTGLLSAEVSFDGQLIEYVRDGSLLEQASWTGLVDGTVVYQYDPSLRLAGIDYGGLSLTVTHDDDDLVTGIGDIEIERNPVNGFVVSQRHGSFERTFAYNTLGELVTTTASLGPANWTENYDYNALGRISRRRETLNSESHVYDYVYDGNGRLERVDRDGSTTEIYEFDGAGRPAHRFSSLAGLDLAGGSFQYDADSRLLAAGDRLYEYDGQGCLSSASDGQNEFNYTYRTDLTLDTAELPGGRILTYLYDARGRRVKRRVDGAVTHAWLYGDSRSPLVEYDETGAIRSVFIYGGFSVPLVIQRNSQTYYLVADRRASPRLVLDATGAIVRRLEYDAYGNVVTDTNPSFEIPFGYGGGLADPDHEMIQFGSRYYQPSTGRWAARDPLIILGGFLPYDYAGGDPVNLHDPSGLQAEKACPVEGMSPEEAENFYQEVIAHREEDFLKEYEADMYAVYYLMQTGYHPAGLKGFLTTLEAIEKMNAEENAKGQGAKKSTPSLLNYKHPPTPDRIKWVDKTLQDVQEFQGKMPEGYFTKKINKNNYKKMLQDLK